MEGIIIGCLLLIIYLLWDKNNKFISSTSNDWLILVWYKEFKDFDVEGNVKDTKIIDNKIYIQFVPIIGWKYNDWSHKYGKLTPITPPIYRVKDRFDSSDGEVRMSYWVRDGKEYEISSELTSGKDFWEDLVEYVVSGKEIVMTSNIPDSFQNKVQEILEKKWSE